MAITDNWFWFEPLAVARLKEKLPDLASKVFTAAEFPGLQDNEVPPAPALHLVYIGDREGRKSARQDLEIVAQRWAVVIVVRNVRNLTRGEGLREDAGPLIMQVVTALQGWRPVTASDPVRRLGSLGARYVNGFLYTPMIFEVAFAVNSGVELDY